MLLKGETVIPPWGGYEGRHGGPCLKVRRLRTCFNWLIYTLPIHLSDNQSLWSLRTWWELVGFICYVMWRLVESPWWSLSRGSCRNIMFTLLRWAQHMTTSTYADVHFGSFFFPLNCFLFRLLRGVDLPLLCCRYIVRNFKPYYCGLWSIGLSPNSLLTLISPYEANFVVVNVLFWPRNANLRLRC